MLKRYKEGVAGAVEGLSRYSLGEFSGLLQTGIPDLDRHLGGGLPPSAMTLIGAPTGGGKTSILSQIAGHSVLTHPESAVLIVSPEMTLEQLVEREIIRMAMVPKRDINPFFPIKEASEAAMAAYWYQAKRLLTNDPPLYLLDKQDATMLDVEEAVFQLQPRVVIVDYAQQIAAITDRPRYLEVGDVATRCIALAQEWKIPVLVASQVNTIKDKGTKSYTFRETAILQQKAHVVLIFDVDRDADGKVSRAEFICDKHRSGPMFRCEVSYEPGLYFVGNKASETWQPMLSVRRFPGD